MAQTHTPATLPDGIEIFRAGRHVDDEGVARTFTEQDVSDMAASYNPALREAPLCIGHPADNRPAWGWVGTLSAKAGRLSMHVRDVAPAFAEMVGARQFKKRSSSFYPPSHPGNPTPGKWYLRHVAFLGAQQPAVAGLADFAAAAEVGCVQFSADDVGTPFPEQPPTKEHEMSTPDKPATAPTAAESAQIDVGAQLKAEQAARERAEADAKAAKAQLAQFAQAQADRRTAEFTHFAEGLVKQAYLPASEKALAVAAMQALDSAKPVEFSEGNTTRKERLLDWFKSRLQAAAPAVQFGEYVSSPIPAGRRTGVAQMSDADFDAAVRMHMRQHEMASYAEAASDLAAGSFTA